MPSETATEDPEAEIPTSDKRDALSRVLSSSGFEGADRLKDFLRYVVEESLAGRGEKILGKRIAQDVYGRQAQRDSETANVVRVDAGRLRRRLESYYSGEGASDPVIIRIEKGGYAPSFLNRPPETEQQTPAQRRLTRWAVLGLAATAALFALVSIQSLRIDDKEQPQSEDHAVRDQAERRVLFDNAPRALQARNLAAEARGMMFPATQPTRLLAALTLFEKAMELDPRYHGGYAGASQVAAMFGGLAPAGPTRDEMLGRARVHAGEAVALAPAAAWSQSAMAFVAMFDRDFEEANRLSTDAVALDPTDLDILEIDAIIAFFSGDFERAQTSASPDLHGAREGQRFPWRSIYGNAAFHLGKHDEAVSKLLEAATYGEPVSEITTAHLIAALQASGRTDEARERMAEFEEAWPNSRVDEFFQRLFADIRDAENLTHQLEAAGWKKARASE